MRRTLSLVTCAVVSMALPATVAAQTTYHLHNDTSAISSANKQLKTNDPDAASVAVPSANLKNATPNTSYIVKAFETQSGVPGTAGTILANSVVSFAIWMRKTANWGTLHPAAALFLNNSVPASGLLCSAGGASAPALTTTLTKYTMTCTLPTAKALTAADRFYLEVSTFVAVSPGNHNTFVEVQIEGVLNGNHDSTVAIPTVIPIPAITGITPASAAVTAAVTIAGTNFGRRRGPAPSRSTERPRR